MPFLLTLTASARVKIQNAARLQEQRNSTSNACCLAERLGSTAKWASFSARSTIVFVYGRFVSGFTHLPPERAIFERYGLQQSLTAANRSRLGTYGCCNQIDCCGFERTCPPVCLLHLYKAHHNAPCAPCLRPAAASRPAQPIGRSSFTTMVHRTVHRTTSIAALRSQASPNLQVAICKDDTAHSLVVDGTKGRL